MNRLFENIFSRVLIAGTGGIVILTFINTIIPSPTPILSVYYVDVAIAFILFTEGLVLIDNRLNRKLPWLPDFRKRLIKQISYGTLWTIIISGAIFLRYYNDIMSGKVSIRGFILSLVFGIIIQHMITSVLVTRTFLKDRQMKELEKEKLKMEKLRADYDLLQNQLNPHFFFNSLNVLISEIRHNQNSAIRFCETLSDVYRYVLQSIDKSTVSIKTEKEALNQHIYLMEVRFGSGIIIESDIGECMLDYEIPPLTIHILIENALKYNTASETSPLHISIKVANKEMTIENSLQPRKNIDHTSLGLQNIIQRYSLLTDRQVIVKETEDFFSVTIPLLGD